MSQSTLFRGVATRVEHGTDVDRYYYHNTAVVVHHKLRHVVVLDNGGYRTVTSKLRMNQCAYQYDLDFTVHQRDFEWYVVTKAGKFVFYNGMRINLTTGKLLPERKP